MSQARQNMPLASEARSAAQTIEPESNYKEYYQKLIYYILNLLLYYYPNYLVLPFGSTYHCMHPT